MYFLLKTWGIFQLFMSVNSGVFQAIIKIHSSQWIGLRLKGGNNLMALGVGRRVLGHSKQFFGGEGKMGGSYFLDEVMEAHTFLGGGCFKYFLFSPRILGEDSHFGWYFSSGLKPPTSHTFGGIQRYKFFERGYISFYMTKSLPWGQMETCFHGNVCWDLYIKQVAGIWTNIYIYIHTIFIQIISQAWLRWPSRYSIIMIVI